MEAIKKFMTHFPAQTKTVPKIGTTQIEKVTETEKVPKTVSKRKNFYFIKFCN